MVVFDVIEVSLVVAGGFVLYFCCLNIDDLNVDERNFRRRK